MNIRATEKDYKEFSKFNIPNGITLTKDEKINTSVIMIHENGQLIEWTRGKENILSYLKYGYVKIIKNCPYRLGKCIGEKCSLYIINNNTGDCAHVWNFFKK